ncbi:MAG: 16S rRNA (guanine(527)-N(7))-methyltransferase RsmG [Aggregatilineales bacterium]
MMSLLQEQAAQFNITLTDEQSAQFDTYASELASWNEKMNLTAIVAPDEVRVRHFLDSISLVLSHPMRDGLNVVDIGTGAGFPGLPLAIAFPNIRVRLVDATGKKITFLEHIVSTLGLKNVRTLHARAEDAGHISHHRARYDLVVARAVARLPGLVEYMLPLARVGGRCIAMKGDTAETEADDSKRALKILGGKIVSIDPVQLPELEQTHYLVVIEKTDPTPKGYPRKPGIPTREPI